MGIKAKKSLGQNFLHDARICQRIVQALTPYGNETVVEIGPGQGALTKYLVEAARELIAVELDGDLIPSLRDAFAGHKNFTLIEADVLDVNLCQLLPENGKARIVGNLPYYISTAILQRLIEQRECLAEMVLMLQREVVERITARAGGRERGYLSVLVQTYCEAEILFEVAPGAFRPAPKVWSAVMRLRVRPRPAIEVADEALLWRVVSAGFAQRRKTIFNNLRHAPDDLGAHVERAGGAAALLERSGLDPQRRAETLTLEEWERLARLLEPPAAETPERDATR